MKLLIKSSTNNTYTLCKERNNTMKRIEEKVIPENVDLVSTIVQLATENASWIYISFDLVVRLRKRYYHYSYRSNVDGEIYEIYGEGSNRKLFVDRNDAWNKVSIIPKKDVYIASDPDVIYFLS